MVLGVRISWLPGSTVAGRGQLPGAPACSSCSWALGFIASMGRGQSHTAGWHPQEMLNSSPVAVYYSVSLSWFLALVSQVPPLCGQLNKSLTSCPFSWQGLCCIPLRISQACSSSQAFLLFRPRELFPTPSLCAPLPTLSSGDGPFRQRWWGGQVLAGLWLLLLTLFASPFSCEYLSQLEGEVFKHPVCKS